MAEALEAGEGEVTAMVGEREEGEAVGAAGLEGAEGAAVGVSGATTEVPLAWSQKGSKRRRQRQPLWIQRM